PASAAAEQGRGPASKPKCQGSHPYLRTKPNLREFASSQPYADEGPRSSSVAHRCRECPGGATQVGSGWAANSAACSASERKPELTPRVSPAALAAIAMWSKAAATSGRIPSPSRYARGPE